MFLIEMVQPYTGRPDQTFAKGTSEIGGIVIHVYLIIRGRLYTNKEEDRYGRHLLDKLTATVQSRITSYEYPNLQFMITGPSNGVCIQSSPVRILLGCCY